MPLSRQMRLPAFVSLLLAGGCSDNTSTGSFAVVAVSEVTGIIVDSSDKPISGAYVVLGGVDRPGFSYAFERATSNSQGFFVYTLRRMAGPVATPQPDTVHAIVRATLAETSKRLPDGSIPYTETPVLLTFAPGGSNPPRSQVALKITLVP